MSFKEAIIIPLETYKKLLHNDGVEEQAELPVSKKVKLNEHLKLSQVKSLPETPTNSSLPEKKLFHLDRIMDHTRNADKPFVMAIIDKIKANPDPLGWNEHLEVIIKGTLIPGSNIIKIFQYLNKQKIVTGEKDVPRGGIDVYNTLIHDLEIPKSWIRQKINLRERQPALSSWKKWS